MRPFWLVIILLVCGPMITESFSPIRASQDILHSALNNANQYITFEFMKRDPAIMKLG